MAVPSPPTTISIPPSKTSPLLTLPLEIRLQIYSHLLLSTPRSHPAFFQNPSTRSKNGIRTQNLCISSNGTHLSTSPYPFHGPPPFCGSSPGPFPTSGALSDFLLAFHNLRTTCRQIGDELRDLYLFLPRMDVWVRDDLALRLCGDPETTLWFQQPWVRERVQSVKIMLAWNGNHSWPYGGDQLVKMYPSTGTIILRRILLLFCVRAGGYGTEGWEFDFRPRYSMKTVAETLKGCTKLEDVELVIGNEAFWGLWKDPVGDVLALRELAEKGVQVRILAGDGIAYPLEFWKEFEKMKRHLGIWNRVRLWRRGGWGWKWGVKGGIENRGMGTDGLPDVVDERVKVLELVGEREEGE